MQPLNTELAVAKGELGGPYTNATPMAQFIPSYQPEGLTRGGVHVQTAHCVASAPVVSNEAPAAASAAPHT